MKKLEDGSLYLEYRVFFLLSVLVRYLFAIYSGIDNFHGPDFSRYNMQSDNILSGDFNLETNLFITAPLFSYVLAIMKWSFKEGYVSFLEGFQIVLSSLSTVYLARMAKVIFKNYYTILLTGLVYAIYPITLYFTHQFSQESIFQAIFIISAFYFTSFLSVGTGRNLIIFSILFSFALLTKSHIILFVPFIILSIFIKNGLNKKSFLSSFFFAAILVIITMPYGIYNKVANGTYVIASSGLGGFFVTGHNDDFYKYAIAPPSPESAEYRRIKAMDFEIYRRVAPELTGLSHQQKQNRYFREGIQWCIDHPAHFFQLMWFNFKHYLAPGFSKAHYPFKIWILALIVSTPVFCFAYFEMIRRIIFDFKSHLFVISVFFGMLIFSLGFYSQNRFRVVTIEPFYLMYACSGFIFVWNYLYVNFKKKYRFRS